MGAKKIFYLILLGIATACSGPEEESTLPPAPLAAMQRVSFLNLPATGYTVSAFRENNNSFTFFESFTAIGATDGKMEIQLPVGNYQFLFASSYGTNTLQQPAHPVISTTPFSAMQFVTREATDGMLMPADELFLQDAKADSIYQIYNPTTIKCTLKRAVAQAILYVKRGWKERENQYQAFPYSGDDNILKHFDQIKMEINGVGKSVDGLSIPSGQGDVSLTYAPSDCDSITDQGFAKFIGPFFFPPANGGEVNAHITLFPSSDSPQPQLSTTTTPTIVHRNEQLIITVWITNDWNFIGVTADTSPIRKENTGDSGIWDDIITPKN